MVYNLRLSFHSLCGVGTKIGVQNLHKSAISSIAVLYLLFMSKKSQMFGGILNCQRCVRMISLRSFMSCKTGLKCVGNVQKLWWINVDRFEVICLHFLVTFVWKVFVRALLVFLARFNRKFPFLWWSPFLPFRNEFSVSFIFDNLPCRQSDSLRITVTIASTTVHWYRDIQNN